MRATDTDSQFVAGFISAFLIFTSAAFLSQVVVWFRFNPQPQALLDFLNTPLFSILDLFTAFVGLLLLFVLIAALRWAPRP